MRIWTRPLALMVAVLAALSLSALPAKATPPAGTATSASNAVQPGKGAAKPGEAVSAAKSQAGKAALVDINSASRKELEDLPGIGKVLAPKIINGRPYANKLQLVEKNVLNAVTYEKIKDLIIAKR